MESVNQLEQQLKEAGEQLALPPSSTKDLLDLLDKIEQLLTSVGQAPSISMQGALVPSMGALIADELLRHSDMDVRVSVASCLCEVARITAPEPPYKDDIMKEIFQLNVTAFGELSNMTTRSYYKAIHILESVAKVRSCLLMLDLECDALILEMFEQFLSRIRTDHPDTVYSNMETIMTLVIEESDEIDTELLSLLISHVRKENQNASPAPWKLAEKVLRNCDNTLKSYSQTLSKLIKSDLDGYAEVVTALCRNARGNGTVGIKPANTNNLRKRDINSLENGTHMHSQSKKQKYTDTQRVVAGPKKMGRKPEITSSKNHQLKGKELEASQNLDSAHEINYIKGQQKNKKNHLNHDTRSNWVQDSKEDLRRTRSQDRASHSAGLSLKENSDGLKRSTETLEKQPTKSKGVGKGSIKASGSLYNVVIKEEDVTLSDSGVADPLLRQGTNKVQNRRKPYSKKLMADDSRGKDPKEGYNSKTYGKELVGCRIKVWWPLDRTYYEGAVSAYDPIDKKHKVLYADGDEEVLDLREEKWSLLDGLFYQQQEQGADLPSPMTTSANQAKNSKRLQKNILSLSNLKEYKAERNTKQKGKRRIESLSKQEDKVNSLKSPVPSYSPKTKPTEENDDGKGAISSATIDNQGLKLTTTDEVEPNPSGLSEDGRLPEESETITVKKTQRLDNNEELVCET